MTGSPLDRLLSDELQANACAYSTAPGLRLFLAQRAEVAEVREALRTGALSEAAVRAFLEALLRGMRPGVLFGHDVTLAAVAVACGEVGGPFADALLRELAEVNVAEIPLAPRLAREFLPSRPVAAVGGAVGQGASPAGAALPPEPAHPGS